MPTLLKNLKPFTSLSSRLNGQDELPSKNEKTLYRISSFIINFQFEYDVEPITKIKLLCDIMISRVGIPYQKQLYVT